MAIQPGPGDMYDQQPHEDEYQPYAEPPPHYDPYNEDPHSYLPSDGSHLYGKEPYYPDVPPEEAQAEILSVRTRTFNLPTVQRMPSHPANPNENRRSVATRSRTTFARVPSLHLSITKPPSFARSTKSARSTDRGFFALRRRQ
eukprot:1179621-Prorocentrum_minimum.AAC.3